MKKIFKNFFFGVVPAVLLILGGVWYQRSSEAAIQYQRNFELLKTACQDSAGNEAKIDETVSEYISGVCGCFAKSALKHRNVAIAGIVNDQEVVHAILKDCSRRLPASQAK